DPGSELVVRHGIVGTQPHSPERAGREDEQEDYKDPDTKQVEPARLADNPTVRLGEQSGGLLRQPDREDNQANSDNSRAEEGNWRDIPDRWNPGRPCIAVCGIGHHSLLRARSDRALLECRTQASKAL